MKQDKLAEILLIHLYDNFHDDQYKKCASAIRTYLMGEIEGLKTEDLHIMCEGRNYFIKKDDVLKIIKGEPK